MSKRILFIGVNPENVGFLEGMKIYERSDIGYMANMLMAKGHSVMVYCDHESLDYEKLDSFDPELIILALSNDTKVIEWAKSKKPGALIGLGTGVIQDVKTAKSIIENEDYVDIIAIGGEPFDTWIEIAECLASGIGFDGIDGIVYRQGEQIITKSNIKEFNINDFTTSEDNTERNPVLLTTSLGCIANCNFCSNKIFHKKWQGRNIESVINEINYFNEKSKFYFHFSDAEIEAPDVKLNRLKQLCEGIISLDNYIWYEANFRPDFIRKVTSEVMDLLVDSGLFRVFVGVESGSQDDLNLYNKKCTVDEAKETVKLFLRYGIHVEIGFMNFQPFSTFESLTANVQLLEELGLADFDTISSYYNDCPDYKLHKKIDNAGLLQNNKRGWGFKNSAIAPLFDFIDFYIRQYIAPAIREYEKAIGKYKYRVLQLNVANRVGEERKKDSIQEYIEKIWIVQKSMSFNICNWFKRLLEITMRGFNIDEAIKVSRDLLNEGYISETAGFMEREHEKLTKILKELDK